MIAKLVYFFAGAGRIPPEFEQRFGIRPGLWGWLKSPLHGAGHSERQADRGEATPTGRPGLFAAPGDGFRDGEQIVYHPAEQTWVEIEDGAWLGIANEAAPADFWRRELVPDLRDPANHERAWGMTTERGAWIIPVACVDADGCQLPMVDRFERGAWHRAPRPAYARVAADALLAWQHERGEIALTPDQVRDICIRALQVNHALTGPELAAMGALFDDAYDGILGILTDRAARKKKLAAASPGTACGKQDA